MTPSCVIAYSRSALVISSFDFAIAKFFCAWSSCWAEVTPSANPFTALSKSFRIFSKLNSNIATYPAWTGIQSLPGYGYVPAAGDSARNGVYQDFGTYVRNYPTRWGNVRASRVNELNLGLFKNFQPAERMKLQLRFEAFNAFNHPRFAAPDTNPANSTFGRAQPSEQNNARAIQMGAKLIF